MYKEEVSTEAFFAAVIRAGRHQGLAPCLADASGLTGDFPALGGFAAPSDFVDRVAMRIADESDLLSRADVIPTSRQSLTLPAIDEVSRQDGQRFGGVSIYRTGEAGTVTPSKPKFSALNFAMKKLTAIIWCTDEMTQDVVALPALLERIYIKEATHIIEQEMCSGSGTTGMLGVMNSPCLITANPETGQGPAPVPANLVSMLCRLWPSSYGRATWVMSVDSFRTIVGESFSNGAPCVTFQGNNAFILGQQVIVSEHTASLGQAGDILLVDWSEFTVVDRGSSFMSSVHCEFLQAETAFRFQWRNDGQLRWKSAITPKNAISSCSVAIALGAR